MLSPKDTIPAETDAARADKINNHAIRIIRQLRTCVARTNEIVARGDKATIVTILDSEAVTILTAIAALATTHSTSTVTNDLV